MIVSNVSKIDAEYVGCEVHLTTEPALFRWVEGKGWHMQLWYSANLHEGTFKVFSYTRADLRASAIHPFPGFEESIAEGTFATLGDISDITSHIYTCVCTHVTVEELYKHFELPFYVEDCDLIYPKNSKCDCLVCTNKDFHLKPWLKRDGQINGTVDGKDVILYGFGVINGNPGSIKKEDRFYFQDSIGLPDKGTFDVKLTPPLKLYDVAEISSITIKMKKPQPPYYKSKTRTPNIVRVNFTHEIGKGKTNV